MVPSRGKQGFPPCSAPRETSPGPLFLGGRPAASPQTRPGSCPSEPDSEGALSSAGIYGLAWPGPTWSLASLQGHWGWRPPGTRGNMNNKFRFFFFQFYNLDIGFQTASPPREVGVWLYGGSGLPQARTNVLPSPQDSLPREPLAMSDDAGRPRVCPFGS